MGAEFNQKKRNKPYAITPIAISKVPETKITNKKDVDSTIRKLHQLLLKTADTLNKKYNNNSMEVGILFDIITYEYAVIPGNKNRVDILSSTDAKMMLGKAYGRELVFMHNHPSTHTFSGTDFRTFCNIDNLLAMTAVGNNGCVYAMIKEYNFNANIADIQSKIVNQNINKNNNGTIAMNKVLKICSNYGITYKKGAKRK